MTCGSTSTHASTQPFEATDSANEISDEICLGYVFASGPLDEVGGFILKRCPIATRGHFVATRCAHCLLFLLVESFECFSRRLAALGVFRLGNLFQRGPDWFH